MELVKFLFDLTAFASIMILVVSGLAVIASLMGIFNMAHGEFVLLGAYVVFLCQMSGVPTWLGMVMAPFIVALVGLVIERTVIRRLYGAPITAMLATFAIGLTLREAVRFAIAGKYYEIAPPLPGVFSLGGVDFSIWRALIIGVTVCVMALSIYIIRFTRFGLQIRGSLENAALARASGLSTDRLYCWTFAIGAGLAGFAGALMVPLFSLSADLGLQFLVQAFLAVMLGGVGTFEGPVFGGALMGSLIPGVQWAREYLGIADFISPVAGEVFIYVLILLTVKMRPQGILRRN